MSRSATLREAEGFIDQGGRGSIRSESRLFEVQSGGQWEWKNRLDVPGRV